MKLEKINRLSDEEFRRLTGVKKGTFEKMQELLKEAKNKARTRGGKPGVVSIETMLLMTLEYLREYRTYFHISQSYELSESYAYKIIRWVEDTLIQSGVFNLPGRKALLKSDVEYKVVLIDASESPIQRPKKNREDFILERKKGIR